MISIEFIFVSFGFLIIFITFFEAIYEKRKNFKNIYEYANWVEKREKILDFTIAVFIIYCIIFFYRITHM